jgi:hypothetical protein
MTKSDLINFLATKTDIPQQVSKTILEDYYKDYDKDGFDNCGYSLKNRLNLNRYDKYGYDKYRFDIDGFNRHGYDIDGYNRDGFDIKGLNRHGLDSEGFDKNGFNNAGFNRKGFNRNGFNASGYDSDGFGRDGFNLDGIEREGFRRDGYNQDGYDRKGFNRHGLDSEGFDKNGFNPIGYDRYGCGRDGYDCEGYDKKGYNKNEINRKGFISPAKWQEIVNSTTPPPSYQNEWSVEKPYSELNEQDLALATDWANAEKDNDYTMARMLSARTAEKIAMQFYQSLGFEVSDVSIKQPVKDSTTRQIIFLTIGNCTICC